MYAPTATSTAFDGAFARYDREMQAREDEHEAFLAYCETNLRDPEDPESEVWWDAYLDALRDSQY